ncbi:MAG: endonuclease [Planctomycetota bacterium]|nr:MAG: endonuclease [Planctomycetota bacterium]
MLSPPTRAAVLLLLVLARPLAAAAEPLNVMTFNIRYGTAPDGENAWPHRRELVVAVIKQAAPDLLGLQEALRAQLDELDDALDGYARIGVGRQADGDGEYSAIYYRSSRFDLQDAGTFWLSETPETPGSTTWGNTLPRICTWARLFDRTSGQRILYLNTHWDHQSQPARLQSAKLMARRLAELDRDDCAVIVSGDLNAAPDNPATTSLLEEAHLRDSFALVHPDATEVGTFNGFGQARLAGKIDYVLVNDRCTVSSAEIIRTKQGDRYPSDHFPVTATIELDSGAAVDN